MSVASEITRLQGIKSDIRTALVAKGITSASTHDMADFAEDIGDIQTGGGITPPTTGSFQGSTGLVKEISVDKKPSAIAFWSTDGTATADWVETNKNGKHFAELGANSAVVTIGTTSTGYYLTVQSVTSSKVTVKCPTSGSYGDKTWNYIFYYKD